MADKCRVCGEPITDDYYRADGVCCERCLAIVSAKTCAACKSEHCAKRLTPFNPDAEEPE